jgi:hypothetical protein
MKNLGVRGRLVLTLFAFCAAFNIAAWRSAAFSDFYTGKIFPVLTGLLGRVTSLFSFSVGEVMLVVLVLLIAGIIIYFAASIIFYLIWFLTGKGNGSGTRAKAVLEKLSDFFYHFLPVLLSIILVIMSLNCFVLYHCTPLKVSEGPAADHDLAQLTELRDYLVKKCNALAKEVTRDEEGNVIYEGDMAQVARQSMTNIEDQYDRLKGFYVMPKALHFSGFMSQQYMQGYYFPFSMEANYNDEMYIMNKPFTMCHELAHTHGYIYEDEANFLGFLACINSEDPVFRYSGYLGVLNYVNNDFYNAVDEDEYKRHVKVSSAVKYDNQFLTEEAWKKVEENAILDTQMVKQAADTFIDTNLKVNGVSAGKVSYTHVVGLLLDYYNNDENNYR